MPNLQRPILEKTLHQNAQDIAEEYIKQFADAVVIQSKTLATLDGADEVQSSHVEKARSIILALSQTSNRIRDVLLLFGSLLLGAAVQGILSEYSTTQRPKWFVFYFVLGVVGSIIGIWGIFRK